MSYAGDNVAAESDILCEGCGYVLNGLSAGARCPECGKPTDESVPTLRHPPAWEAGASARAGFLRTTWQVIAHPARFYRTFATRRPRGSSVWFARLHCGVAALLFGAAAYSHLNWYLMLANIRYHAGIGIWIGLTLATYIFLAGTIGIAARLTHWEGSYRGYRLPLAVVRRGLDYHTAHYLPVAFVTAVLVRGHEVLLDRRIISILADPAYLYLLSGVVLLAAFYLFETYWVAMRNMMYANA